MPLVIDYVNGTRYSYDTLEEVIEASERYFEDLDYWEHKDGRFSHTRTFARDHYQSLGWKLVAEKKLIATINRIWNVQR